MPFTSPSAHEATDFGCHTGSEWGMQASVVSPFWVYRASASVPPAGRRLLASCEGQVPHNTVCGRQLFLWRGKHFRALTVPETSYLCVVICPKSAGRLRDTSQWFYRDSENRPWAHICRTSFKCLASPPTLILQLSITHRLLFSISECFSLTEVNSSTLPHPIAATHHV